MTARLLNSLRARRTISSAQAGSRRPTGATLLTVTLIALLTCSCGGGGGSVTPPPPPPQIAPPSITTSTLLDSITGQPYTATFDATGGVPPYTWTLVGSTAPPGLTLSTNGQLSGTPNAPGFYSFTVQVRDAGSRLATKGFSLVEAAPLRVSTTQLIPVGNVGLPYIGGFVVSTGGWGSTTWSLSATSSPLPAGLNFNSDGRFSGTPTAAGTFSPTVQVRDSGNPPQTGTGMVSFTINNEVFVVGGPGLPLAVVGVAYQVTFQAVGGTPPYAWAATSGQVPPGLTLSPSGVLSGTPQQDGSFLLGVVATDSSAPPKSSPTRFFFPAVNPTLQFTATPLADAVVGRFYSPTLFIGGAPPYTARLSAGALPPGFSLSSPIQFTNPISGLPSTEGSTTFDLEVQDSSSPALSIRGPLTIRTVTRMNITTNSLSDGLEGRAYSATVTAVGGMPPYTWIFTLLPAGLTGDPATGAISGVPSAPSQSDFAVFQVRDTTSPPQFDSRTVPLRIIGKLDVATSALPTLSVNSLVRIVLGSRGGIGPFSWSVVTGSLPAGLNLNPATGEISGTATTVETTTFTVQVADPTTSIPQTAQLPMTWNVVANPGRNDTIATATPLSNGRYAATLSPADAGGFAPDHDYYRVTANAGAVVRVETFANRLGTPSPLDTVIEIVDASGTRLNACSAFGPFSLSGPCMNDDEFGTFSMDSRLFFQVPGAAGTTTTFYMRVLSWDGQARPDYRYEVSITGAN